MGEDKIEYMNNLLKALIVGAETAIENVKLNIQLGNGVSCTIESPRPYFFQTAFLCGLFFTLHDFYTFYNKKSPDRALSLHRGILPFYFFMRYLISIGL